MLSYVFSWYSYEVEAIMVQYALAPYACLSLPCDVIILLSLLFPELVIICLCASFLRLIKTLKASKSYQWGVPEAVGISEHEDGGGECEGWVEGSEVPQGRRFAVAQGMRRRRRWAVVNCDE